MRSMPPVMHGQADLPEVVLAGGAVGGLAHPLHGQQEHANEDGDDGDHHQQFDQGETHAPLHRKVPAPDVLVPTIVIPGWE